MPVYKTSAELEKDKETLHSYTSPALVLDRRITQLEDALLAVVGRLAVLERQMEAINGESSETEIPE